MTELPFCGEWLSGKTEFIVHTSGSTGAPKPIVVKRSQMQASATQTQKALGLNKGDTALICLSTNHIAGKMMLVRTMEIGLQAIVVEPCSNPFAQYDLDHSFDFIALVPLQMEAILASSQCELLNSAKAIIIGGSPVSAALEQNIQKITSPVYHTYGMTETVSHIALRRINGVNRSEEYEALEETHLSCDDRGCLVINSSVTDDLDVITNDLVDLTNNRFKWLGRVDRIINSGGVKINPEVVEKVVEDCFLSEEVDRSFYVIGIDHETLGQEVSLIIEGAEFDTDALRGVISHKLSRFEIPRRIDFVNEFSYTPTGKIDRFRTIENIK